MSCFLYSDYFGNLSHEAQYSVMYIMRYKIHARSKFKNSQMTLCGLYFKDSKVTFNNTEVTCKRCIYEMEKSGQKITEIEAWKPGLKKQNENELSSRNSNIRNN